MLAAVAPEIAVGRLRMPDQGIERVHGLIGHRARNASGRQPE